MYKTGQVHAVLQWSNRSVSEKNHEFNYTFTVYFNFYYHCIDKTSDMLKYLLLKTCCLLQK